MRPRLARLFPILLAASTLCGRQALCQSMDDLRASVENLSLDPNESYRVRDIHLRKGDVNIYLNEGYLSFATPVGGHIVAAYFTTKPVDAGDAEVLLMPPNAGERRALAHFSGSPNMDEHFSSALLYFSDTTRRELMSQIASPDTRRFDEPALEFAPTVNPVLRSDAQDVEARVVRSLLRDPQTSNEFFFGIFLGRSVGQFSLLYDPSEPEPVLLGAMTRGPHPKYQMWTSYRPRGMASYIPDPEVISDYAIESTISPDLALQAKARFKWRASVGDGRAIHLNLSRKLLVESVAVDGAPAEFIHKFEPDYTGLESDSDLLVAAPAPLIPASTYKLEVAYKGRVIRQVSPSSYFVSERNTWYPHTQPLLSNFDLTFHFPAEYQLVSTGEPISDEVLSGVRTVRRATSSPQQLAGFNFGVYESRPVSTDGYQVQCYATGGVDLTTTDIPGRCAEVLHTYTSQWLPLPTRNLSITPIPGYFGQGFPGLIYLSETAYISQKERPSILQNTRGNTFFEDILLAHELAHQWWGNLVSGASYREEWLMESMADYSAIQLMEMRKGRSAMDDLLTQYRNDQALKMQDGAAMESAGPVTFGPRVLTDSGPQAWQVVVYEKGSWIIHMLRERMGQQRFHQMQVALLQRYSGKSITNEQFREIASEFLPPKQNDPKLTTFFEAWVYGTGIPTIRKTRSRISVTQVDDDFTFDIPLTCGTQQRWMRLTAGDNPLSAALSNCQLPKQTEFLYTSNEPVR